MRDFPLAMIFVDRDDQSFEDIDRDLRTPLAHKSHSS